MSVLTNIFIKNKKPQLCFGDNVAILNNLFYGYGVSIFFPFLFARVHYLQVLMVYMLYFYSFIFQTSLILNPGTLSQK
jgi:hypothetical protein